MKNPVTNRCKQFPFVAVIAFVFIFAAHSLKLAQGQERKLKPGDEISIGGGWFFRIVECRTIPNGRLEECDYIPFNENGATRDVRTSPVSELSGYIRQNEAEKKRQEIINKSNQTKNPTKPPIAEVPAENTEAVVPPSEIPNGELEIKVTAQQLYQEYGNNETAAMRKYVGKTVRVTDAFVNTIASKYFIAANNKTIRASMIAQCYVEDLEQLAAINRGETVTIVGTALGNMLSTGVVFEPCRVERQTADQTVPKTKTPVKNTNNGNGKVAGTWYYTTLIGADGTEKELANRASYLWLKEDGSYENRFGASGQIGTYTASGSRLTLNRENVGAKTYTMTISGNTMTLKSGAGGYKLERE